MVTTVEIVKNIPHSNFYTGSGLTTINLVANKITFNTKKNMVKTSRGITAKHQDSTSSDTAINTVLDLKRIEDTIVITGWIEDESGNTAWNKAWQLRAMCVAGNIANLGSRLSSVKIGGITFDQAQNMAGFIEQFTFTLPVSDVDITSRNTDSAGNSVQDIARIEFTMTLYMGTERVSS